MSHPQPTTHHDPMDPYDIALTVGVALACGGFIYVAPALLHPRKPRRPIDPSRYYIGRRR